MRSSWFALLAPCALLALSFAGCGRGTAPTSPALSSSRSAASTAGLSSGVFGDGGQAPTATPPGRDDAPPRVQILDPQPNRFLVHLFPADLPVTIRWTATDPDGPGPGVKSYRYVVLDLSDASNTVFLVDPDSLLRRDGPAFTNWTEVDGQVDRVTLEGLSVERGYVLYVIAFDRRREHDPQLDLSRNGLMFDVMLAGPAGVQAGAPVAPSRRPDRVDGAFSGRYH
jgi:hypothetical protein